nr:hypothetical protein GCM10025699_58390 [Microbacterium flavescens]
MRDRRPLSRLADRWQGVLLTLVVGVATLWLAATGQLILYIHPRYVVFTVIMIAIGMVLSVGVLALSPARERDDHDHDHDHEAGAHDGPDHGAGPLRPRRPRRGAPPRAGSSSERGRSSRWPSLWRSSPCRRPRSRARRPVSAT